MFSPDGKTIVSVSDDETMRVWDVQTATQIATLQHADDVNSVSFSPDSTMLATANSDGTVLLWDIRSTAAPMNKVEHLAADLNGDGEVNIQDLVAMAAALGKPGEDNADLNGDGEVNIQDLVAMAAALGEAPAAPSGIRHQATGQLIPADVQHWIIQAQRLDRKNLTTQRGIHFLQYLLTVLTPQETVLLPNYPNPFNPETWIPYQLSKPAEVNISIYAVDGTLVRTLDLGHQPVGTYQGKSRAAYWDGRNAVGEPVASGVYFYTFTTGEFTATRKMLIVK